MHHGCPLRKMRPQPHPICVTNPHPGWHHIIHHAGELIHPIHHNRPPGLQLCPGGLKTGRQTRAVIRPHHIRQQPEYAIKVQSVWFDQSVRQ